MRQSDTQHRRAPARPPLSDEAVELITTRLRVISDPTRIRLLELLNTGDGTIQELTDRLPTTHQNVARHLSILYHSGMVSRRREASRTFYSLADWTGWWLIEQIGASLSAQLAELRDAFDRDSAGSGPNGNG